MFDHGEGCYLYDTEGKKYLDFAAGIAVNSLGYHYPGYDEALKAQIDKLTHISNLYYNEPMSEAGEKLVKASGLSKAFFTNSGTEAIEGALKSARKYAYTKYGKEAGKYEIIAMNQFFSSFTHRLIIIKIGNMCQFVDLSFQSLIIARIMISQ